jgi:bifunctional DNA-binding transcriptional regulator/antitoxin component of YhaV-PrlF toxin-antitoxin module
MADKPKLLRFLCTVSENGQIFIPVKMREVSGINPKDVVQFECAADGKISFCKAADESVAEQGLEKKQAKDQKKREESQSQV